MTKNVEKYNIVSMIPDDKQTIVGFLKKYFFRREPLVVSSKLPEDVESIEKLEKYGLRNLDTSELILQYYIILKLLGIIV